MDVGGVTFVVRYVGSLSIPEIAGSYIGSRKAKEAGDDAACFSNNEDSRLCSPSPTETKHGTFDFSELRTDFVHMQRLRGSGAGIESRAPSRRCGVANIASGYGGRATRACTAAGVGYDAFKKVGVDRGLHGGDDIGGSRGEWRVRSGRVRGSADRRRGRQRGRRGACALRSPTELRARRR